MNLAAPATIASAGFRGIPRRDAHVSAGAAHFSGNLAMRQGEQSGDECTSLPLSFFKMKQPLTRREQFALNARVFVSQLLKLRLTRAWFVLHGLLRSLKK